MNKFAEEKLRSASYNDRKQFLRCTFPTSAHSICGLVGTFSEMQAHMAGVHTGCYLYSCGICENQFAHVGELHKHRQGKKACRSTDKNVKHLIPDLKRSTDLWKAQNMFLVPSSKGEYEKYMQRTRGSRTVARNTTPAYEEDEVEEDVPLIEPMPERAQAPVQNQAPPPAASHSSIPPFQRENNVPMFNQPPPMAPTSFRNTPTPPAPPPSHPYHQFHQQIPHPMSQPRSSATTPVSVPPPPQHHFYPQPQFFNRAPTDPRSSVTPPAPSHPFYPQQQHQQVFNPPPPTEQRPTTSQPFNRPPPPPPEAAPVPPHRHNNYHWKPINSQPSTSSSQAPERPKTPFSNGSAQEPAGRQSRASGFGRNEQNESQGGYISMRPQRPQEIPRRRSSVNYRSQSRGKSPLRPSTDQEELRELERKRQEFQVENRGTAKTPSRSSNRAACMLVDNYKISAAQKQKDADRAKKVESMRRRNEERSRQEDARDDSRSSRRSRFDEENKRHGHSSRSHHSERN